MVTLIESPVMYGGATKSMLLYNKEYIDNNSKGICKLPKVIS